MRILLICQQSPHLYPIPAYGFWRTYFVEGLREAGHDVVEIPGADWARGLLPLPDADLPRWRDEQWSRTLAVARGTPGLDLLLSYLYPRQIDPSAVRAIRELGLPTVNFFCDNVREFRRIPEAFRPFDLHWVPETKALPLYHHAGLPFVHAPMPVWVDPRWRSPAKIETTGPVFIGSRDPVRESLLGKAAALGAEFTAYGSGWKEQPPGNVVSLGLPRRLRNQARFLCEEGVVAWFRRNFLGPDRPLTLPTAYVGRLLTADDYVHLTRESAVLLGINRFPSFRQPFSRPDTYSRLRDIEAPMLGACYLTEWTEGLDGLFEIGPEIEIYRDAAELTEKIRLLLGDGARRRRMRTAAQRHALSEHTVGRSVARIAERLGIVPRR
jgi:hypothetical protein